ncbi:Uncharacterised protein [Orientia tsutsugamushi]|nr:Uncharacterised protein [Orientia tsutsugamushi]
MVFKTSDIMLYILYVEFWINRTVVEYLVRKLRELLFTDRGFINAKLG